MEGGALELGYFSTSYLAERAPELAVLDLPFAVARREAVYAALDGELGRRLADGLAARSGFRVLGWWDNGFRHLTNRVRPIRAPADCRGLRLRTLASELQQAVFRALGFEPVFLDPKDLVPAVRSGAVDAQENPLTNIWNFGIHADHRHLTLSAHVFGVAALLCHAASWRAWPAEVRQAVAEAAAEAGAAQRRLAAAEDVDVLARLEAAGVAIVRLTDDERGAFARAVEPAVAPARDGLDARLRALLPAPAGFQR